MKTVDEHGTTVYFNIPHDAVVTASKIDIKINVGEKSFMQFGKASNFIRHASNYFWLTDEEFAILQKEIEDYFAKDKIFLGARITEESIEELYGLE